MRLTTHVSLAAAAVVPLLALGAASASAMPARAGLVAVQCGATSYQTWVNGNGHFTPAHDLGSTSMLIPLAFGPSTFVVRDAGGNIVDQGTDPGAAKGSSEHAAGAQWCTFSLSFTSPDGLTFTNTGSVLGKITPLG